MYPMLTIHILICVPFPGEEWPFPADDFSSKKCGECWIFLQYKVKKKRHLQLQFVSQLTLPFLY